MCICQYRKRGRVGRDKVVKRDGGGTEVLKDSGTGVCIRGSGVVVSAAGQPSSQIGGQPANRVMSECCL